MQAAEVGIEGAGTEKNVFESHADLIGVLSVGVLGLARERLRSGRAGCRTGGEGKREEGG